MSNLKWIFDPAPPSGAESGGIASSKAIDTNMASLVREALQNSWDAGPDSSSVKVRFTIYELDGEVRDQFLEAIGWATLVPHLEGAAATGTPLGQIINRGGAHYRTPGLELAAKHRPL